jgi:hypothetical protein
MTGPAPLRFLAGLSLAVVLASCAGGGANTAADDAAASAAQHVSGAATPGRGTEGQGTEGQGAGPTTAVPTGHSGAGDGSRGNPGAPGADPAGDGGADAQAQGNPGAPGDVAVFEEAGVPYSALADDAASRCAGGVCTLLAPVVGAGNPDDLGGVEQCVVQKQSDIRYDPPAQGGFFRHGATVQATVDCTVQDSGSDDTPTTDATPTAGASDTSGDTPQGQVPADQSQG